VYRLYYRVWNPIYRDRPDLSRYVAQRMNAWTAEHDPALIALDRP
jgi:hypothetical protein